MSHSLEVLPITKSRKATSNSSLILIKAIRIKAGIVMVKTIFRGDGKPNIRNKPKSNWQNKKIGVMMPQKIP